MTAEQAVPAEAVLRIRDLQVRFKTPGRQTTALSGIDLDVGTGEIVGVVGETGCGKTVTGLTVLGLLPDTARVEAQEMRLLGDDLLAFSEGDFRKIRGSRVSMVFQNPANSFNPVFTIGSQMRSVLAAAEGLKGQAAMERIHETMAACALPDPERVTRAYPHQLSGGMLQRAMLCMALLSRPQLLIADEPTTALDVTIAAQILELILSLQQEMGFSVLFITHDLGVVRRVCRSCRRAVRGTRGGDGPDGAAVRGAPASVHPAGCWRPCRARTAARARSPPSRGRCPLTQA